MERTAVACSEDLVGYSFIYLFIFGSLAAFGFSLVAGTRGNSLVVVHGLLIMVASLVAEHRL